MRGASLEAALESRVSEGEAKSTRGRAVLKDLEGQPGNGRKVKEEAAKANKLLQLTAREQRIER